MEQYTWVDRQVGKRGRWQRVRLADLPDPPELDDKITMQRFASPTPLPTEPHKSSFVLDFDAHAEWLDVEICRIEVLRFLGVFSAHWNMAPDTLAIAFSGRAGFHVTIPATLLGNVASPHLTLAYRAWASAIKDSLGLLTLDAPSRHPPEWWEPQIVWMIGYLPLEVADREAFALVLRRPGIYSRRRMIRREGSRHPGSGLFKIPLSADELAQGMPAIRALARTPRIQPVRVAPSPHAALAAHVQGFLAEVSVQTQRNTIPSDKSKQLTQHDITIPPDTTAPVCIQRLLTRGAPPGGSNRPLMTLAAYWRTRGISVDVAIHLARQWLLQGVANPTLAREREEAARTVVQAAYTHRYQFARRFVAPLRLVDDEECTQCPLRAACWRTESHGDRGSTANLS